MRVSSPFAVLCMVALGAGAASMTIEIAAGRIMTPHVGGTVYTWGALIGAFMAGMSVGYDIGGRLADRWPDPRILAGLLLGAGITAGVIPLYASDLMPWLATRIEDLRYAALLGGLIMTGLPAALLAATGPYCVRIGLALVPTAGRLSGRLSALGAAGSIVGTLGTSFYLIPHLGLKSILLYVAFGCAALACMVASMATRIAPAAEVRA